MLALVILAFLIVGIFYRKEFNQGLQAYIEWVEGHPVLGYCTFMLVNIALVPLLIPGTVLAILGSYIYGLIYGITAGFFIILTLVIISNTIGGYIAFLVSRGLFYECLQPTFHRSRYMRAMNKGISHNGFKIILLFRLCPIVPYNIFNYVSALTDVTHRQYFWATLLGMAPIKAIEVLIFINLTVDVAKILEGDYELGLGYKIMLIIGAVMAVGLIILMGVLTKRELNKELLEVRRRRRSSEHTIPDQSYFERQPILERDV